MTLTQLYPVADNGRPAALSYGARAEFLTDQPFAIGDHALLQVRAHFQVEPIDIWESHANVAGSSRRMEFWIGWDDVGGNPEPVVNTNFKVIHFAEFGPNFADVPLDFIVTTFDNSGTIKDGPQTFLNAAVIDVASMQTTAQPFYRLWEQALSNFSTLNSQITTLQNLLIPNALHFGASFVGLTGHGSIAPAGAIGWLVHATTIPASWSQKLDTPVRYIPSYCRLQAADATHVEDFATVHYDQQIFFRFPPWATQMDYNIEPLWTLTITRLLS